MLLCPGGQSDDVRRTVPVAAPFRRGRRPCNPTKGFLEEPSKKPPKEKIALKAGPKGSLKRAPRKEPLERALSRSLFSGSTVSLGVLGI